MSFGIEDLVSLQGVVNAIRRKTPFADTPAQVKAKAFVCWRICCHNNGKSGGSQGMGYAPVMVRWQWRVEVGLPAVAVRSSGGGLYLPMR